MNRNSDKTMDTKQILEAVAGGNLSVENALLQLPLPDTNLDFACIDNDRQRRRGMPEVIYAPGKTNEHLISIISAMCDKGHNAFATRVSEAQAQAVLAALPDAVHHSTARALTLDCTPLPQQQGAVGIVCAGTTDIPVAEEAALTAQRMGAKTEKIYDVGVAGLHRIAAHLPLLRSCRTVIVAAGMEGALPSVVGGLVDCPLIAVPTSTGYGAGGQGLAALLAMLNSCVPGISVVNIDNGFGAGVCAAMINRGKVTITGD